MSDSFNNTNVIKIRDTMNGLHLTFRSPNNPDCIQEYVLEKKEDNELQYSLEVIYFIADLLNLEFRKESKWLRLEIVEDSEDCD